ncbi:hypothetical protein ALO_03636 [Acetonema longum DSM 6540]|uniref:Uncharacterized protein n=1 Tax=Acetonema longum DSM 6540 TaxID=1009370 RepID=F7NFA0_9FIRM|nr:hypothetical protein ALO_03636 [Acetonema longum DSM 6540]
MTPILKRKTNSGAADKSKFVALLFIKKKQMDTGTGKTGILGR